MKWILAVCALALGFTLALGADNIPAPKAVPITEVETLKIKEVTQRRTILLMRLQALDAEARQIQEELKNTVDEQIKLLRDTAAAHSVDLKTYQLDAEVKNFVPAPPKQEASKQ